MSSQETLTGAISHRSNVLKAIHDLPKSEVPTQKWQLLKCPWWNGVAMRSCSLWSQKQGTFFGIRLSRKLWGQVAFFERWSQQTLVGMWGSERRKPVRALLSRFLLCIARPQSSWGILGNSVEMSQVVPFEEIAIHQLLPVIHRGLLQGILTPWHFCLPHLTAEWARESCQAKNHFAFSWKYWIG